MDGFRFKMKNWKSLMLIFGLSIFCWPALADIIPLDISHATTTAFADEIENDGKGGWIDAGSHDMRLLPPGPQIIADIPFSILSDSVTRGKSCIVLGNSELIKHLPKAAKITVAENVQGKNLYLLHAGAQLKKKGTTTGILNAEYTDGSKAEFKFQAGKEICDWIANKGSASAAHSWSIYNNNTQVSLYITRIFLGDKPLQALYLEAENAVWMIAAISIGNSTVAPREILPELVLKRDYPVPESLTIPSAPVQPENIIPKNIILIIGDGMGQGSVKYASLYGHGAAGKLVMEQFPVSGMTVTKSANADVTDSAASGTALSSGYKTNNRFLGVTPDNLPIRTLAEQALRSGKAVGIMTTDALTGATPAAFMAHVNNRGASTEIASWIAKSGFHILIGNKHKSPFLPLSLEGRREDNRNLLQEMQDSGYVEVNTLEKLVTTGKHKMFGFVDNWTKDITLLSRFTSSALQYLSNASTQGFFIMIESAEPDWGGHRNNSDTSLLGVLATDFVARAAAEFAMKNGDTLVLVTADHETGGMQAAPNQLNPRRPFAYYGTGSHTNQLVPIFALGPGAEKFNGLTDNTDIPRILAEFWQLKLMEPLVEALKKAE